MLFRFLLCGLALLTFGTATITFAQETRPVLHWMLTGVPPKFIPDGPLRGTGYGEQQVAYLAKRLPQFQHRVELVTPARLWHEMQAGQGVCSLDIADLPEREKWAAFTRHQTSVAGYRLLVLQDRLGEFSSFRLPDGTVDLDRLAASDRLTGIYVATRHYTTQINSFIESSVRKIPLESTSTSTKIFEMIAHRRGDFSFASVTEMNYFKALYGKRGPSMAMLPIKGGGEPVHGHTACSRDPLGLQTIEILDHLFDDEAVWKEFLAPQQKWLADVPLPSR